MDKSRIKIYSLGCRLNALEAEKIRAMLDAAGMADAVVINTCAVTHEALRQSRQQFRKILRENPGLPIFATGCGAAFRPDDFTGATVIGNKDKFNPAAYGLNAAANGSGKITRFEKMQKKGFVQIGDGCDRNCTYCITRILRGRAAHFPYGDILDAARALIDNGYKEIILTGVNIADWKTVDMTLRDLCQKLLADLPEMERLTLSSLDPAADLEPIIELISAEPRMTPQLHLSVQSGSDEILCRMGRRHNAERIRCLAALAAKATPKIKFSWDIICGFPGESEKLFDKTVALARELKPVKIHAFPFSARPGTIAATMPDQVSRARSKVRVAQLLSVLN